MQFSFSNTHLSVETVITASSWGINTASLKSADGNSILLIRESFCLCDFLWLVLADAAILHLFYILKLPCVLLHNRGTSLTICVMVIHVMLR